MAPELLLCDERGRILLPKEVRKQYGQEFHLVKARDEIVLIPSSKDPLKELAGLGKQARISHFSLSRLKQEIRKQAKKEL